MSLRDKVYPVRFESITKYKPEDWPKNWLEESEIGDLLLAPGEPYANFGLLCISDGGAFLNLTQAQIYYQDFIPWPDEISKVKGFQLIGDKLKFERLD